MKSLIKYAKELVKNKEVKEDSPNLWSVADKVVTIKVKKGRNIMSCSCQNYARFVSGGQICSHMMAVILFKSQDKSSKKLDEMINFYKKCLELDKNIKLSTIIFDLEDLKREK